MRYYPCSLALGGGGLKGAAHVGILKVFEEEGFPIEYISGSSAGALVGALYASGYTAEELCNLVYKLSKNPPLDLGVKLLLFIYIFFKSILNWLKIGHREVKMGLIDGQYLEDYLKKIFGPKKFEDLRYPLMVTAVDLRTGRLQVFTDKKIARRLKGIHDIDLHTDVDLATAIRASTAIPGIFTPLCYKNMVLVDGGVKDNVPADLLRFAGARKVVAVDLVSTYKREEQMDDILDVLFKTVEVMGEEITDLVLERYADFIIRPEIKEVSLKDYQKLVEIYEIGYKIAKRAVKALQSLLRNQSKEKS
ncbi:hypothetical protein BBF96_13070 [Anoxybacter fermentans]|uniref:PNPLA domain-containing protein n=1 Tax=Anoxybacter fermentans TaxID=1323375 RepID=A0A3S9T0Z9_9FIRM|nr:patatin-like phospholipase family protein [Anoxybacter fermentans]AZR74248.1 hypothetical protein BBF96_13070 [Anoxybacter fermentans]